MQSSHLEIDGYIRRIENQLHPIIIPSTINHLIHLFYDPWFDLATPPKSHHVYPKPVCYSSCKDDKTYILITPYSADSRKCIKYDIKENEWTVFATYPVELVAECHTMVMDQANDLLYIIHGYDRVFATFDLIKNRWNVMSIAKSTGDKYGIAPSVYNAVGCVLPESEIHILTKPGMHNCHIRYDKEENKFIHASIDNIENGEYLDGPEMVFVKGKNMLMAFGGYIDEYTDKIWYAKYIEKNQKNFEWNLFGLRLPERSGTIKCIVVFDMVLIIRCNDKLWILDLGNDDDEYQWIQPIVSNEDILSLKLRDMVATNDNYLHFINCYKERHHKIHLSRFLPSNIYTKYTYNNSSAHCY